MDYGLIEYENYHKALAQGIPTIPPMAYFRRTNFGLTLLQDLYSISTKIILLKKA